MYALTVSCSLYPSIKNGNINKLRQTLCNSTFDIWAILGVYCAFKDCLKNSTTISHVCSVSDFDWSRKLVQGGGDNREEVLRQFCEKILKGLEILSIQKINNVDWEFQSHFNCAFVFWHKFFSRNLLTSCQIVIRTSNGRGTEANLKPD